jgi:hypothetical protein
MDYHKNARLTMSLREELARRVGRQCVTLKLPASTILTALEKAKKSRCAGRNRGICLILNEL